MVFSFSYKHGVSCYVGMDYEQRLFVPAYGKPFALSVGVELGAFVPADDFSPRVGLVSCLLDVFLSGAISLCLEFDVRVVQRRGKLHEVTVRESAGVAEQFHVVSVFVAVFVVSVEDFHDIALHGLELLLEEYGEVDFPHETYSLRVLFVC